jgi:hypothetical protein
MNTATATATATATPATKACPFCSKTFKNLRLHIAKAHEKVHIVVRSAVVADDSPDITVSYNGIPLDYCADYGSDNGYMLTFSFPESLKDLMTYEGITVDFSEDDKFVSADYFRWSRDHDDGECKSAGKIADHRLTCEYVPAKN